MLIVSHSYSSSLLYIPLQETEAIEMLGLEIADFLSLFWLPTSTFFLGVCVTAIVLRRRDFPAEAPRPPKKREPDDIGQVSTSETQITKGLGDFSKLPIKVRLLIWQELVPEVVYHSNSLMVARQKSQDISPLLVASRAIFDEFSTELYRTNPICYFPIDFMDRSFTWANCRFLDLKPMQTFLALTSSESKSMRPQSR